MFYLLLQANLREPRPKQPILKAALDVTAEFNAYTKIHQTQVRIGCKLRANGQAVKDKTEKGALQEKQDTATPELDAQT